MKAGPDIAFVAALLGDPARANMLSALVSGEARTAGELAREAGVTPQTASAHLEKLAAGRLVTVQAQGRHRYYALSGEEVAEIIERLMSLAARTGRTRARPGPTDPALRRARVCYDHLAGDMGVAMLDGLVARRLIVKGNDGLALSKTGEKFLRAFDVDLEAARISRRPLCKNCLDWSVRRHHLAGTVGAALLRQICARGWARREKNTRVVAFTPKGQREFDATFATR